MGKLPSMDARKRQVALHRKSRDELSHPEYNPGFISCARPSLTASNGDFKKARSKHPWNGSRCIETVLFRELISMASVWNVMVLNVPL
jgi:hypothetical protein